MDWFHWDTHLCSNLCLFQTPRPAGGTRAAKMISAQSTGVTLRVVTVCQAAQTPPTTRADPQFELDRAPSPTLSHDASCFDVTSCGQSIMNVGGSNDKPVIFTVQ